MTLLGLVVGLVNTTPVLATLDVVILGIPVALMSGPAKRSKRWSLTGTIFFNSSVMSPPSRLDAVVMTDITDDEYKGTTEKKKGDVNIARGQVVMPALHCLERGLNGGPSGGGEVLSTRDLKYCKSVVDYACRPETDPQGVVVG